jgi:hypothetical protein
MRPGFLMIAALPTLAILATPASTTVAANSHHRSHVSGHRPVPTQPPARIACTVIGCQPIPAACMPVPGRTWRGMPTGYDVIVCPPR